MEFMLLLMVDMVAANKPAITQPRKSPAGQLLRVKPGKPSSVRPLGSQIPRDMAGKKYQRAVPTPKKTIECRITINAFV